LENGYIFSTPPLLALALRQLINRNEAKVAERFKLPRSVVGMPGWPGLNLPVIGRIFRGQDHD
jgi:hypothetical protein